MKKRGFTLVELIAIIVILSIIALITTPIIMNVIESARKSAAERSIDNIKHAAELYYYKTKLDFGFSPVTFICKDGACSNGETKLNINGNIPERGSITINKQGTVTLNSLVVNGYICYEDGDSYLCDKANKISIDSTNTMITLGESKSKSLSNYIINGNSYQETRSGKNLLKMFGREVGTTTSGYNNTYVRDFDFNKYYVGLASNNYNVNGNAQFYIEGDSIFVYSELGGYGVGFPVKVNSNTNYVIYFGDCEDNIGIGTYDKDGNYIGQQIAYEESEGIVKFTTGENVEIITIVLVPSKTKVYKEYKNIQLEEGTSATDYEPYGKMPSSEFPSEIQCVGDLVTDMHNENYGKYEIPIKVYGKNLFDVNYREATIDESDADWYDNATVRNFEFDKFYIGLNMANYNCPNTTGVSYKVEGDSMFVSTEKSGYGIGFPVKVKSNTNYVLSCEKCEDEIGIGTYDKDGNYLEYLHNIKSTEPYKFTTRENVEIITIVLRPTANVGYKEYKNIQLEEGTKATTYELAKKKTYGIFLNEPLRCLGNVCDYIDYENQKVFRYIKVLDNTGTKAIEDSFEVLTTPKEESVILPKININKNASNIMVDSNIKPSSIILDYYN